MSENLYYEPLSEEVFDELKKTCIELWSLIAHEPSYLQEKISRIQDLENIKDNGMHMVAMFDIYNQQLLANLLSTAARREISDRIVAGGGIYNPF